MSSQTAPLSQKGAVAEKLVDVRDLVIGIQRTRSDRLLLVDSATFHVQQGEMLGLVGESGSGKTMVCRSLIGTLKRRSLKVFGGSVMFKIGRAHV